MRCFTEEPAAGRAIIQAAADDLDGDRAPQNGVSRTIDLAHAARCNEAGDLVDTESCAGGQTRERVALAYTVVSEHVGGRRGDEIPCPAIAGEQGFHFGSQTRVARAGVIHEGAAFALGMLERAKEHCLEALPSRRIFQSGLMQPIRRARGALDLLEWWHGGPNIRLTPSRCNLPVTPFSCRSRVPVKELRREGAESPDRLGVTPHTLEHK